MWAHPDGLLSVHVCVKSLSASEGQQGFSEPVLPIRLFPHLSLLTLPS